MPPKHNSYRKIGLDEETVEILKREKALQEKYKSDDENYMTVYEKDGVINYDEGNPVDFIIKLEHGAFKSPNTRQQSPMLPIMNYKFHIHIIHSVTHMLPFSLRKAIRRTM